MSSTDTHITARHRRSIPVATLLAGLLVVLSGCLPYSCRREESTAILASDSLSREIATTVRIDTLRHGWTATDEMAYPRTVRFGSRNSDSIFVSDAERNVVFVYDTDGRRIGEIGTLDVPYIAGVRGDTLAVFSPSLLELDLIADGEVVRHMALPDENRPKNALVYAAYDGDIYYKRVGPGEKGFIARIDTGGRIGRRVVLPGPHWRHAGLLRTWGDTLVSLSGFRPVVDLIRDSTTDTLALRGFDSPMMARSRSFMMGDVREAPLLSTSAASDGRYLFVLNIRAGWLQIDVFDRDGLLKRRLIQRDREYRKAFFPQDIDVRRDEDGAYLVAVVLSKPSPELRLYRWEGMGGPGRRAGNGHPSAAISREGVQ